MPPIRTKAGHHAGFAPTTRHNEVPQARVDHDFKPGQAPMPVDDLQPNEKAIALDSLLRLNERVEARLAVLFHRNQSDGHFFVSLDQSRAQWRDLVSRATVHLQTSAQAIRGCLRQIEGFLSHLDDQPGQSLADPAVFVLHSQAALQQVELAMQRPDPQGQVASPLPAPLLPPRTLAASFQTSAAAPVAQPPAPPAPSATHFVVRRTLQELQPLADGQVLPAPYAEILALPMVDGDPSTQAARGRRHLRFFAAMEGLAQPFAVVGVDSGRTYVFDADPAWGYSMREVMRRELPNPNETFNLIFGDGAGIQVHGTQFPSSDGLIGPALSFLSEEFTRALHLVWQQTTLYPQQRIFERFWESMTEVCFDANITKLNQFLQEENLVGEDLSLVPNLEGKATPWLQIHEYLRVFRLRADRLFAMQCQEPREDRHGNYHPRFVQHYFNDDLFWSYLAHADAFPALSLGELTMMITHLKEAELLLACPAQPQA